MCRMCLVEVDGPRRRHPAAGLLHRGRPRAWWSTPPRRRSRRPRTACSSSCWSTTRSTARSATRAASARCRTRPSPTGRARAASSRRSGTSRSRSPSPTSCCLDRERCIQCARCTRFAEEVAGEAQIDFAGRGELVEVATFPTEPFSSYFSGNTVQICPVGALTATPYRFTARPWDLDQVESTCTTCSVGLPGGRAVLGQPADPPARHRLGPGQPRLAVRQGPLRLRVGQRRRGGRGAGPRALADEAVDVAPATAAQVVSLGATRGQFLGEVRETGASSTAA